MLLNKDPVEVQENFVRSLKLQTLHLQTWSSFLLCIHIIIHSFESSSFQEQAVEFYDHPGPTTAMDRRAVEASAVQNPWPTTPRAMPGASGTSGPPPGQGGKQ